MARSRGPRQVPPPPRDAAERHLSFGHLLPGKEKRAREAVAAPIAVGQHVSTDVAHFKPQCWRDDTHLLFILAMAEGRIWGFFPRGPALANKFGHIR